MKRYGKLLLSVLLSAITLFGVWGLAGCEQNGGDTGAESGTGGTGTNGEETLVWDMQTVYAKAQELGYSGTLEEFIASISGRDGEKGEKGEDGEDGVGISSASINLDGNLIITLSNGSSIDCGSVKGENGQNGQNGTNGVDGVGIETVYINSIGELIVKLTGREEQNLGKVTGENGQNGSNGSNGTNGIDGVGIESIYVNTEGELIVKLTGQEEKNLGKVKGEDGSDLTACEHSYGEWAYGEKESCCSIGYQTRTCLLCGNEEYLFTKATGHTYGEWQNLLSSCAGAWYSRSCTDCGNAQMKKEKSTVAHTYENGNCTVCQAPKTEGLEYTLSEDKSYYTISGVGSCTASEIVLPQTYGGLPVKEIGANAFYGCTFIVKVVVSETIVIIRSSAFAGCENLVHITVGGSVTDIESGAFTNCDSLVEVYNKSSLELAVGGSEYGGIGQNATTVTKNPEELGEVKTDENGFVLYTTDTTKTLLQYTGTATEIVIPDGVTVISKRVFYENTTIVKVVIAASVTLIEDYAFYGCTNLVSVTIGENVTSIDGNAFYNCYKLVEVYNRSSLEVKTSNNNGYVGYYALNIYSSEDGSKLVDENGYVFYNDVDRKILLGYTGAEKDLIIPNTITEIYRYAFYYREDLTSVKISDSVTSIGPWAFAHCSGLTNVEIGDNVSTIDYQAFCFCDEVTNFTIGKSVSVIESSAFNSTNINNLYYTGNIADWCNISFADERSSPVAVCSKFYINEILVEGEIVIPNTVTEIKPYAFMEWEFVTKIVIPDSVTKIGYYAFYGCAPMKNITIPDSIISIDIRVFDYCGNLQYNEYDKAYYLGNESNPYLVLIKAKDKYITDCLVHENTKLIYYQAFNNCSNLLSVTIGDNIVQVGNSAFSGCENLTDVYITDIENWCKIGFNSSSSNPLHNGAKLYLDGQLSENITIPESITEIKNNAFYGCSLKNINLPNNIEEVSASAFTNCNNLHYNEYDNAYYLGNEENLYLVLIKSKGLNTTSCIIHEQTRVIADKAFYNNDLSSITIPDNVIAIGEYAFQFCNPTQPIIIGQSVVVIGDYAFSDCEVRSDSSADIIISKSVKRIGKFAFYHYMIQCVSYEGTMQEWNSIEKLSDWCHYSFIKVICTDGTIYL